MQTIFNKLYNNTKSVKLGALDDNIEMVEEAHNDIKDLSSEAVAHLYEAELLVNEISLRLDNVENYKTQLNEMYSKILDLGLEVPEKLDELDQTLNYLVGLPYVKDIQNDLEKSRLKLVNYTE